MNYGNSPDFSSLFLIIYIAIGAAIGIVALIFILNYLKKYKYNKGKIPRSINMILLHILVPKGGAQKEEGETQGVREIIAKASQLFSSLYAIKNASLPYFNYLKGAHISFEIASFDEKIRFYVAVPREIQTMIEKQIHGVYPSANIEEVERYNIFHERTKEVAAELTLKQTSSLPLKTYKDFEVDTLDSLTTALSKLKQEDGAAIQVIIRPAKKVWQKNAEKDIEKLSKGEKIGNQGFDIGKSLKSGMEQGAKMGSALSQVPSQGDSKEKGPTETGSQQMKMISEKMAYLGFETIIRIVVSSPEKATAKMHLSNILGSFSVFTNVLGNGFKVNKKIKEGKVVDDFIFRHFPYDASASILNVEELASVFHLPNKNIETPNIVWLTSKRAPIAPEAPKEGIFLGNNIFRGVRTPVYLKPEDRLRHIYAIGMTGSGKSTLFKEMILQDIKNGEGCCYIEPHGTDIDDILQRIPKERAGDVILFDPSDTGRPLGINLLEFNRPEEKGLAVNELLGVFDKLYNLKDTGGPMFEQYFRNAALLIMEHPESGSSLLEIPKVLVDEDFRAFKLSKCNNPIIKNYWIKEAEKAGGDAALQNVVPYITSKMTQFLANDIMRPIIVQQKSAFNFREAMDSKKIILVKLAKGQIGEMNAYLLGLLFVSKLYLATMSRADAPDLKKLNPFYLYIDEFQNFATDSIADILAEARKYKLSLNITHQFIGQLDEVPLIKKAIFGNVGTKITFRIGTEDAEFMEKEFESMFNVNDIIGLSNFNSYIKMLADGSQLKPFSLNTLPNFDEINANMNPKLADAIRKLSRLKYGRDRDIIEEEIRQRA